MDKIIKMQDSLLDKITNGLTKKIDDYFVEGLRRKGFTFNNPLELEDFIISRCTCEDNVQTKEKIYFIDNTPFLLQNYNTNIDLDVKHEDRKITMSATCGSFAYL